jgi:hypothetical protein
MTISWLVDDARVRQILDSVEVPLVIEDRHGHEKEPQRMCVRSDETVAVAPMDVVGVRNRETPRP